MDTMHSPASHELPEPQQNNAEVSNSAETAANTYKAPVKGEVGPANNEPTKAANDAVAAAMSSVAAVPVAATPLPTPDPAASQATTTIADDSDVIEKEWVDKAKKIVAETKGDPHKKSQELTGLKREYIETRFGKVIKVPHESDASA